MNVAFVGGPVDGQLCGSGTETVLVPVDVDMNLTRGEPYAMAIYKRRAGDQGSQYQFLRFARKPGESFRADFVGGPMHGLHDSPHPPHFCSIEMRIPLDHTGKEFSGAGEIAGVATYKAGQTDGIWRFEFVSVENSELILAEVREAVDDDRIRKAIQQFYQSPDYSVYTKTPTDRHVQVAIKHGHRIAGVDETIAPLIMEIWKRNWETLGSCEETTSGKAYISFPITKEGKQFYELLIGAGIEAKYELKRLVIGDRSGGVYEYQKPHVTFSPSDISRIVDLMRAD